MIQQEVFFKRHVVRLPPHLMTPTMSKTDVLEFPMQSIWHYPAYDAVNEGPPSDDFILRNITEKIFIEQVTKLTAHKGSPRVTNESLNNRVREWQLRNRRFRPTMNVAEGIAQDRTLAVVNYGFLPFTVNYVRSIYSEYYKWFNIQATMWNRIKELTLTSDRTNFIVTNLPKTLPSVARMDTASNALDSNNLKWFNTHESLLLLELWKWMSADHRKDSVIPEMTAGQYDKVNIIIMESGRWLTINLGVLERWRFIKPVITKDMKPEEKVRLQSEANAQKTKIPPDQMQKRFLRTMMTLMENRTVGENPDLEEMQAKADVPVGETSPIDEDATEHSDKLLKTLDEDLEQLQKIEQDQEKQIVESAPIDIKDRAKTMRSAVSPEAAEFDNPMTPESVLKAQCDKLAADGMLSGAEYLRYTKQIDKFESVESPVQGVLLKDFVKIHHTDLELKEPAKIRDMPAVIDKSMLEASLNKFDKNYVSKVLDKDIAGMLVASQRAGFVITKYEKEVRANVLGKYEMHTVRISPLDGQPSTIRFKLPKVEDTGQYRVGGIDYRARKQRTDRPIVKITPSRVAISSYYGKSFVSRSDKKTNDYGTYVRDTVRAIALSDDPNKIVTAVHPAAVFDPQFAAPRIYTILAQAFRTIDAKGFTFYFNHKERETVFTEEDIKKYEKNGVLLVGKNEAGVLVSADKYGTLYFLENGKMEPKANFESYLGVPMVNAPVDFAQVKIFGKNIPVAFVLSYKYGFSKLLEMLKVQPRKVNVGQRRNLQENEYAIEFGDEVYIFNRDDQLATMVLAGWNEYARSIKNYSVHTLDKKGVYLNVLEHHGLTAKYLREIDLMDDMFVDPITEELLRAMNEPVTYRGLLVRAAELLIVDQHASSLDMQQMRIRGYERFAGAVYGELVNVTREHRAKPGRSNAQMTMNPYKVWKDITQDPAVSIVEDINPIMNLKESEATTYGGTGGRNARAMVQSAREYHPSDMGVISESTTDSGDVAINTYLSANPQFNSVRGTTTPLDMKNLKTSALLSTSSLLAVGAANDDMKRANFTSIQNNHGVACDGYHPNYVRTGYEQVIAHRVGTGYATTAKQDGVVVSRDDEGMVIKYKDGSSEGIQIGRRYGASGGLVLAHQMVSEYKVGEKFKEGDVIAYNSGFFERDRFNKTNVLFKMGMLATVALLESKQTHEDACSISAGLSTKLSTNTTKIKDVQINFNQKVSKVLSKGTVVEHDSILCIIEDSSTAGANLFDEESLNTLRMLSSQTPTAKINGVIERVEVYYNGDKEDMHDSLRTLANTSDKELATRMKARGEDAMTGEVDESFRIEGEPLVLDTLCIRYYITSSVGAGVGDKIVIGNQLKSVISEIMEYEMKTKSGQNIDIVFGGLSVFNRIVQSPFIIGTTNPLSSIISKNAAKIYKGEMKP